MNYCFLCLTFCLHIIDGFSQPPTPWEKVVVQFPVITQDTFGVGHQTTFAEDIAAYNTLNHNVLQQFQEQNEDGIEEGATYMALGKFSLTNAYDGYIIKKWDENKREFEVNLFVWSDHDKQILQRIRIALGSGSECCEYTYTTTIGDVNGDGAKDIFISGEEVERTSEVTKTTLVEQTYLWDQGALKLHKTIKEITNE